MTRKKKERGGTPPRTLPILSDARMEIKFYRGRTNGVLICGCREIVTYTHECIELSVCRECVRVTGHDLWCRSYGNRVAEVIGDISEITFVRAEHG